VTAASTSRHRTVGLWLLIAALACFGFLDAGTQAVGALVPVAIIVWTRYVAQLAGALVHQASRRGLRAMWHCHHPRLQLLRGVLLVLLNALAVLSLMVVPVGDFTAICMLTPAALTLVAVVFHGERITPLRWLLIAGGFSGALLVLRPGTDSFDWALLLPVVTMLVGTAFQVVSNRLASLDSPSATNLWTGLIGAVLCTAVLPWQWQPLSSTTWLALGALSLLCALGHGLIIVAHARVPLSQLAPFLYFQIGFAVLAGWMLLDQRPDGLSLVGICVIALCGAWSSRLGLATSR
jgi:drug/metabolite transporter (DMT)-like permease